MTRASPTAPWDCCAWPRLSPQREIVCRSRDELRVDHCQSCGRHWLYSWQEEMSFDGPDPTRDAYAPLGSEEARDLLASSSPVQMVYLAERRGLQRFGSQGWRPCTLTGPPRIPVNHWGAEPPVVASDDEDARRERRETKLLEYLGRRDVDPTSDAEAFEDALSARDGLLAEFGLPETAAVRRLLDLDSVGPTALSEQGVRRLLEVLEAAGDAAEASTLASHPCELLRDGLRAGTDACDLLAGLRLPRHVYGIWVVERLVAQEERDVETLDLLQRGLRAATPYLDSLGRASEPPFDIDPHTLDALIGVGAPWVHDFLASRRSPGTRD